MMMIAFSNKKLNASISHKLFITLTSIDPFISTTKASIFITIRIHPIHGSPPLRELSKNGKPRSYPMGPFILTANSERSFVPSANPTSLGLGNCRRDGPLTVAYFVRHSSVYLFTPFLCFHPQQKDVKE